MSLSATASRLFDELGGSDASPAVVARLRAIVDGGADFDAYKINAFRLAHEEGVPRADAVRALLFATRLGIFDLNWDVHCPSCRGVPEFHKHLMSLKKRAHCELCEIDWDLDFEQQLEVTFTVNPDVRKISVRGFKERVFPEHMEWFRAVGAREGRVPVAAGLFSPGETRTIEGDLEEGDYVAGVPSHTDHAVRFSTVSHDGGRPPMPPGPAGPPAAEPQTIVVRVAGDGSIEMSTTQLSPGRVRFEVHYGYRKFWGFGVHSTLPEKHWLSAAYLTSQQDFRDLFGGEFLAPDASFALRSTTLMFTDIKGSTEMYEDLGDARAYAIVQEHFRLMTGIVRKREGGIVKTIGDAVMASFPVNVDGVRAACEIQAAFAGTGDPLRTVEIKIGLHRGPTIAVSSNRSLDYFGRTVNVAARAQGVAKPREVLLTGAVASDPSVTDYLTQENLAADRFEARVKGVSTPLELWSVRRR